MAALNATKAYKLANRYDLFCKLMKLGLLLYLLNVVIYWHLKLKGQVGWNSRLSDTFNIWHGISQGSFNLTWLFNVQIFELIGKLYERDFACYIILVYISCLFLRITSFCCLFPFNTCKVCAVFVQILVLNLILSLTRTNLIYCKLFDWLAIFVNVLRMVSAN